MRRISCLIATCLMTESEAFEDYVCDLGSLMLSLVCCLVSSLLQQLELDKLQRIV
eukprot:c4657_g2_i1 orf=553-717(+)